MRVTLYEWLFYDEEVARPEVDGVLRQIAIQLVCTQAPQRVEADVMPPSVTSFHDGTVTVTGRLAHWGLAEDAVHFEGVVSVGEFEIVVGGAAAGAQNVHARDHVVVRGGLSVMSRLDAGQFEFEVPRSDWLVVAIAYPAPDAHSSRLELELRPVESSRSV
jgi:hypothetical protein